MGLALDAWQKRPWLIIIAVSILTGGPLVVPFLLLHLHPGARKWVRRLSARYHDALVTVDENSLSVSRQLRAIPLRVIRDLRVKKKDEGGSVSLDFKLLDKDGDEHAFTLYHLSEAEADAAADFILERVNERRGA